MRCVRSPAASARRLRKKVLPRSAATSPRWGWLLRESRRPACWKALARQRRLALSGVQRLAASMRWCAGVRRPSRVAKRRSPSLCASLPRPAHSPTWMSWKTSPVRQRRRKSRQQCGRRLNFHLHRPMSKDLRHHSQKQALRLWESKKQPRWKIFPSVSPSCRNHGSCPWCLSNRLHRHRKRLLNSKQQ